MSGGVTKLAVRTLDALSRLLPAPPADSPAHLATGRRGEEEAYFYLRRLGYVVVARNYRSPRLRSELDLVAWDGDVLCFVEVKTRSSHAVMPAEAAVDQDKQRELSLVARDYWRRLSGSLQSPPIFRFDIVSVYCENKDKPPQITLFRNAFSVP